MDDVVFSSHVGNLMVVAFVPKRHAKDYEYRIQIGDYSDLESFIPRDTFTLVEIPIVTRLLNQAYPAVFAHLSNGGG